MPIVSADGQHTAVVNPRASVGSSRIPSAKPLSSIQSQATQNFQNQIQAAINSARQQMVTVPTYSPSYFTPTDFINKITALQNSKPNLNNAQLQSVAQQSVNLLTNPQIEDLRKQISGFKALIPQSTNLINQTYGQAIGQTEQNAQNIAGQAYQDAQAHGGLKSGAAAAINSQAIQGAQPVANELKQGQQADVASTVSALNTQIQNAQSALQSIEDNKANMTQAQYNALRDQATQQWQTARNAQIQVYQSLAELSQGARQSAAQLNQQSAVDTNTLINQLLQQQLQGIQSSSQEYLKNVIPQLQQQNLNAWLDYVTGGRDTKDALNRLSANKNSIINQVGQQGYQQLLNQLQKLPVNYQNPNYQPAFFTSNATPRGSGASSGSNNSSGSSFDGNTGNAIINSLLGSLGNALNPIFGGL